MYVADACCACRVTVRGRERLLLQRLVAWTELDGGADWRLQCLTAANYCVTSSRNSRHRTWHDMTPDVAYVWCGERSRWACWLAARQAAFKPSVRPSVRRRFFPLPLVVRYDDVFARRRLQRPRWQLVRMLSKLHHDLSPPLFFFFAHEWISRPLKIAQRYHETYGVVAFIRPISQGSVATLLMRGKIFNNV